MKNDIQCVFWLYLFCYNNSEMVHWEDVINKCWCHVFKLFEIN